VITQNIIFANNRTISPFHLYGEGYIKLGKDPTLAFICLKITKNASTWLPEVFGGRLYNYLHNTYPNSQTFTTNEFDVYKKIVVFLRDPIARWISGVVTCAEQTPLSKLLQNPMVDKNSHLEPQISFCHGLNIKDVTWFNLSNDNFSHSYYNWCSHNLDSYNCVLPSNTMNEKSVDAIDYGKKLTDYVYSSDRALNLLQDLYAEDIELYNSVNFYETR